MLLAGVVALCAESCSWLKAVIGPIHLDLHKADVVFVLDEATQYDLNALSENVMLMMLPLIVGLYELKTTSNLTKLLSSTTNTAKRCFTEVIWCAASTVVLLSPVPRIR